MNMHHRNARSFAAAAVVAILAAAIPAEAHGQWPDRPIRLIVPYVPGAMGDIVARLIGERLQPELGQPVVVDNRPGAGGSIGARAVEQAAPDGYTLLIASSNNLTINQFIFKDLGYDPLKRFDPVTILVDVPSVLFVNAPAQVKSFKDFVAYAKANPGKLNYGSPGIGTTPHLSAEAINRAFGLGMAHIPYRGASQVVTSLLAGDVQFYLAGAGVAAQFVREGKLRALAVSSQKRIPALPDTPTFEEAGIGGINASNWWAVAAPAGTPKPVIEKLRNSMCKVMAEPQVQERLVALGDVPICNMPAEMARQIADEAAQWERALPALGIKAE